MQNHALRCPPLSLLPLMAVLLGGCGGAGVRYAPPVMEHYQQVPLLRPSMATTFSVSAKGTALAGEALAIEGMTRVPAGGDLQVVIDHQGATPSDGTLRSSQVCVANAYLDAEGRAVDLTEARNFKALGFTEPIIAGPLHLIVSYWIEGSIQHRGVMQVLAADQRVLSSMEVGGATPVAIGRPVPPGQPFRETPTLGSRPGAHGQDATLPGASDAAANLARSYFEGAFTDYQFVDRRGFLTRSTVLMALETLAQTQDTLGKKAALRAWDQGVSGLHNDVGAVLARVQAHLTAQYASGPRQLAVAVAEVAGNAAVGSVSGIVRELVALPVERRASLGVEALLLLDAALADTRPEDARARAVIRYDRGLVHYLLGDFPTAGSELLAARAENAKEQDGFFGTAAHDLALRIDEVSASASDRAQRLATRR
jgi:hypothetical protein